MDKSAENPTVDNGQNGVTSECCRNCGAELKGMYCHVCGQEVMDKTPTITGFVMEYLNNAFIWDSQFLKTFWTLIRRPGHLTNEFLSGKFISQEHPLKLNMFLLFVFVTLFVFFADTDKFTNSINDLKSDERVLSGVQLELLMSKEEYAAKVQASPRDTVCLMAPLLLAEKYPEVITNIETKEDTGGEALDRWVAVIPRLLIEDKVVQLGEDGNYRFNTEVHSIKSELELINSVGVQLIEIVSNYFPMLLLLTAPFLSISLSLVQRRSRLPHINHFIFSLHYMALLEFLMICIFVLHLTVAPSMELMEGVLLIGSCVYLTIAFRRVYAIERWSVAIVKSLLTSLIYFLILLLIFVSVFLAACFIIVADMA